MRDFSNHDMATEREDGRIYQYHVPDMWKHVEDFETTEIDLSTLVKCINDFINRFDSSDWQRVIDADLSYPVIVNDVIGIADGCHRTVKAMMLGYTHLTCKHIDFNDFQPTKVWNSWDEYNSNP